jgi:hypothetical protein
METGNLRELPHPVTIGGWRVEASLGYTVRPCLTEKKKEMYHLNYFFFFCSTRV